MSEQRSVRLTPATEAPWTALAGIPLGPRSRSGRTPDLYALVEERGRPLLRLDIHDDPASEVHVRTAAEIWRDWIVVGRGESVHLVRLDRSVRSFRLASYFQGFVAGPDDLLVVHGAGLVALGAEGEILWQNDGLALDGIEVESVDRAAGVVRGRGEWDPPGGWRPFVVRLADGRAQR